MEEMMVLSDFMRIWYVYSTFISNFVLFVSSTSTTWRRLLLAFRHGPFDIRGGGGGGGAWNFGPGREIFFGARLLFALALRAGLFFHNHKLHLRHIGFRDIYLCLIQAIATTSCLMHPFATTSYSNLRLSRQIHTRSRVFATTAVGTTRQLHSQLNTV